MKQTFLFVAFLALVTSKSFLFPSIENCGSSGKTLTFTRCYVDASHKVAMIQSKVSKKIHNFTATGLIQTVVGSKYKQIFKYAALDWCKFMSKKVGSSAAVAKIVVEAIKETSGNLFHECPYFGDYEANVTVSKDIVSLFPLGLYRATIEATNEFDDDFFHVTGIIEIK